jgi:FolB domain-containing protein
MRHVAVHGLAVDVVVGIYGGERVRKQCLLVDLEARLPKTSSKSLAASIDYARMAGETRFMLESAQFELLESAAAALTNHFLSAPTADAPRADLDAIKVVIDKPDALGGYGTPRVTLEEMRAEIESYALADGKGRVDVLFEGDGCGVYRVVVNSGASLDLTIRDGVAHDLTLGGGLRVENQPVRRGIAHTAKADFVVRYSNQTATEQTFLRVTRPAIRPEKARGLAPAQPARDEGTVYYAADDV